MQQLEDFKFVFCFPFSSSLSPLNYVGPVRPPTAGSREHRKLTPMLDEPGRTPVCAIVVGLSSLQFIEILVSPIW
jgi:hypothetical protein